MNKWGSCFKCSRGSMLEAPYFDWMEWQAGYAGGAWNGPGITTSLGGTIASGPFAGKQAGLGYAEATEIGSPATFSGQAIDDTTVVVKYTFFGDADLDGDVDGLDIGTWATNFTGELGGAGTSVWTQGDWDYDGDVDGLDAGAWATNFTGELGGGGLGPIFTTNADAAAILSSMGIDVVPEPALSVALLPLAALAGRRRC